MAAQNPQEETAPTRGVHPPTKVPQAFSAQGFNSSDGGNDNRRGKVTMWLGLGLRWPAAHMPPPPLRPLSIYTSIFYPALLPDHSPANDLTQQPGRSGATQGAMPVAERKRTHPCFGGSLPADPEGEFPSGRSLLKTSQSVFPLTGETLPENKPTGTTAEENPTS